MRVNQRIALALAALFVAAVLVLVAVQPAKVVRAQGDAETPPYEVAVEMRESRYIDYATFDALSVSTHAATENLSGDVTVTLTMGVRDWTDASAVYIRMENVAMAATLANVNIADAAGTFFRPKAVDFVKEVGTTSSPAEQEPMIINIWNGYLKFDLSAENLKVIGGSGTELLKSDVAVIQFVFYYNQTNNVNIGDIVVEKEDGTTFTAFSVSEAAIGGGANQYNANDSLGGVLGSTLEANARVAQLQAGEVKSHDAGTAADQWQQFYGIIPGDISMYDGISYYIDNSIGEGALFFNKCLRENEKNGVMEHWFVDGTASYATYYPADGGESYVGNANVVPEGFVGTIVVPFSDLQTRSTAPATIDDGVLDLTSVWTRLEFAIDTQNNDYPARSFIIKDIKLVSGAQQYYNTTQEVSEVGDVRMVNSFNYMDDYDLTGDWNIQWSLSAEAEIALVDSPAEDVVGVGGKAMQITCGQRTSVADANQDACIQWSLNSEQGNATGAKGVTYWIKNTSYSQIGFRFEFDSLVTVATGDGSSTQEAQRWQSLPNCRYMLFDTKTGAERMMMGKSGVYIPAGFEGYVRIDFSQFTNPNWVTVGGDLDLNNPIVTTYLIMNSTYHYGDSFIFDSLGWYYTDVDLTTTFRTPANSFVAAMNSDYDFTKGGN